MLNVVGEAEGEAIIASSAKFANIINYSMSVEVNEQINEIEDEVFRNCEISFVYGGKR